MLFDESRKFSLVFRAIETSGKPWVAAINGLALGGAFELTLSCHYRVAAENPKTRLGLPEVKVGLFPGAGGTQRVPRIVPPQDAMQLLLKGEAVNLAKAKALKLVDAVVPAGRPDQDGKGLDQGRRQGGRALGREGLQAARRPGLFQGRHDDVPGRQCDLPPRDLRQLSRRARHHAVRLRGLAVADRRRACASSRATSRRSCAARKLPR